MAAENSSNAINVDTSLDSDSKPNRDANDMTDHDSSSKALVIPAPAVCLVRFAGTSSSYLSSSPPEFVLGSPSSVSFSPKETIRYGEPYPSFLLSFFSKAVNWMQFHFLAEKPYWVFSSDS